MQKKRKKKSGFFGSQTATKRSVQKLLKDI
jgi:hypothetical protein